MDVSARVTRNATTKDLLRSSVVALEVLPPGSASPVLGTGFFVAPRVVATCAHVLADSRLDLPLRVSGSVPGRAGRFDLAPVPAWYFDPAPGGLDLAFLWTAEEVDTPSAVLSDVAEMGDPLAAYGHPDTAFRGGQSAAFEYVGPSRIVSADREWEPHRVHGTPVAPGYSGSPVLNLRTGAVCGMLCLASGQGSAHMVSAADILAHLPEDAIEAQSHPNGHSGTWLSTLSDEQIRAGGWRYPGPRLRDYLGTAIRAALRDSYPMSVTDAGQLELPSVYVGQTALSVSPLAGVQVTVPADQVFESSAHAFVFGGPGMGKSTLLRMGLMNLAESWLQGNAETAIPVRVRAVDLVEAQPLPQLIAASAEADLSAAGVVNSWSPEFFGTEPLRDVRWMVLVDGLDDIVDAESRKSVLAKLAGVARGSQAPSYQFIIASRPLPAEDITYEGEWVERRYELRPFDVQQLQRFADQFLEALGSQGAVQASRRLVGELERTKLRGIARVPLMATMLCQLLAIDSDRQLPDDLAGIYQDFVETLAAPQYAARNRGIYPQAEAAFRPYGHAAVRAVSDLLDRSAELLARIAVAKREGVRQPALDLMADWAADARPTQIPERRWREFLKEILRRSGLLTERLGDFVFVHESIADYLAARTVVADETLSLDAFEELFYRWWWPWPGVPRAWRQPPWRYSYTRFLVALWPDPVRTADALRQVAEHGGLGGCEFVLALLDDGIRIDSRVIDAASATLARVATMSVSYGFAARRALEMLARLHALDSLVKVMTADRSGEDTRDRCAIILAEFGDTRGADRLAALAVNSEAHRIDRFDAYVALSRLGDSRAANLLPVAFASLADELGDRGACEHLLTRTGRQAGLELLAQVTGSDSISQRMRFRAAHTLVQHGDQRGGEFLARKVLDRSVSADQRFAALTALGRLHDPRAVSALRLIAESRALSASLRLQVTKILLDQKDTSVPSLLAAIASDPFTGGNTVIEAVGMLAEMRAKQTLTSLAAATEHAAHVRGHATKALIGIADDEDTEFLVKRAKDQRLSAQIRAAAAETLDVLRYPSSADLLVAMAEDTSLEIGHRVHLARLASAYHDPRAIELDTELSTRHAARRGALSTTQQYARKLLFTTLCQWPATPADEKTRPARLITFPQCLDLLAASAADASAGILLRRTATEALSELGDDRGRLLRDQLAGQRGEAATHILLGGTARICLDLIRVIAGPEARPQVAATDYVVDVTARIDDVRTMAADTFASFNLRLYSAEILSRLGDERGNELLAGMLDRRSINMDDMCRVAAALARADDSRGANFLRTAARDPQLPLASRKEAAKWLRWMGDPHAISILRAIRGDSAVRNLPDHDELDLALGVRAQFEDSASAVDLQTRRLARQALVQFSNAENVRSQVAIATDSEARFDQRRQAIRSLGLQGAADELAQIAKEANSDYTVRCWAAEEAAWLGEPRAAEILVWLVGNPEIDSYTRRRAAYFLVRLGDSRGTELLTELATDPESTVDARRTAAQLLSQLDFADQLKLLALDPDASPGARINAVDLLAANHELDALVELRQSRELSHDVRRRIARALDRL